jgi:DNA repair exonuclease SbcCD ATPase subunit
MQLPAQQRRDIIEDLLDIQIFSTMNVLLKEHASQNKTLINDIKHDIDMLEHKIQSAKEHNDSIRQLKEVEVSKLKGKIKEQIALIETEQAEIDTLMAEVKEKTDSIADKKDVKEKQKQLEKLDGDLESKLSKLRKDIQFYENHDNCPTCKQGIEHEFKSQTVTESTSKIEEIKTAQLELADRLNGVETRLSEISDVEDEISALNLTMSEHNANYKTAMNTCKGIKKELEQAEKEVEEVDDSKIQEL